MLDLLDYRPSFLEPVPKVVLVEGKSDFYLLRYARDVLGLGADIKLVPGGGSGSLGPLISLYLGWGKSLVVLLDNDSEGRKQRERYESNFGTVLRGRCLTLSELCDDESVKAVESILGEGDRNKLIGAIFSDDENQPKPKKALRQAVMELYARGDQIPLSSDSADRIAALLDQLADALARQDDC